MGTYSVKPKDTLWDIANNNNTTVNDILKANPSISNPNLIYSGQTINLPGLTYDSNSTTTSNTNTNSGYEYKPFQKSTNLLSTEAKSATANELVRDYYNKGYTWSGQDEYNTLRGDYNNWLNTKFNYDFNADALYQQYKDKYIQQGKMAMQDTMGQATALTGGYGNSYASTAGNQAYQASLQNLNDVIPQLYQMAYSMHQDKGQNMLNQLGLLESDRAFDYGQWVDKGTMLNNDRTFWQTEANNLYDKEYTAHNDNESMLYQAAQDALAKEQWNKNYELSERQVALDEDKWDWQKKNSTIDDNDTVIDNDGGNDDEGGGLDVNSKEFYADWDASMWNEYFADIRNDPKGGGVAEAKQELNRMIAAGLIPQKYISVASTAARGQLGH